MDDQVERYLKICIDVGILTTEKIRKYPLRVSNFYVVLKAFAVDSNLDFEFNQYKFDDYYNDKYYLTDSGLNWLYVVFSNHSLDFNRRVYMFLFHSATKEDMYHLDRYDKLNNFRGESGNSQKYVNGHKAVIVRHYGKNNKITREFEYENIKVARKALVEFLRYYPVEQFEIFTIHHYSTKAGLKERRIKLDTVLSYVNPIERIYNNRKEKKL